MVTFINNVLYKTGIAQQHEELEDSSRGHFYKRMTQHYILISLSDLSIVHVVRLYYIIWNIIHLFWLDFHRYFVQSMIYLWLLECIHVFPYNSYMHVYFKAEAKTLNQRQFTHSSGCDVLTVTW